MMDSKLTQRSDLQLLLNGFNGDSQLTQESILTLVSETDETTALRIIARFVETLDEIKKVFELSALSEKWDPVWMLCHKVSSSAELLGFMDFSHNARLLGKEIKDSQLPINGKIESSKAFALKAEAIALKIRTHCQRLKHYR